MSFLTCKLGEIQSQVNFFTFEFTYSNTEQGKLCTHRKRDAIPYENAIYVTYRAIIGDI